VTNWNQVDPSFPDVSLKLYGAGTDSGTFDYFTDAINGEEGASRTDYSATEDDNVTVQGVTGDRGALGYFGFSYFEENQDQLEALEVDGGNGCVAPSVEAAQDDTYTPLSRPLFMYVKLSSLEDNAAVGEFVRYALENQNTIAEEALYVPLSQEQIDEQLEKLDDATA
jgi:phosphate transport system substrate-binding protein